jgi:hypothetical protein
MGYGDARSNNELFRLFLTDGRVKWTLRRRSAEFSALAQPVGAIDFPVTTGGENRPGQVSTTCTPPYALFFEKEPAAIIYR